MENWLHRIGEPFGARPIADYRHHTDHEKDHHVDDDQLHVCVVVALKGVFKIVKHSSLHGRMLISLPAPGRDNEKAKDHSTQVSKVSGVAARVHQKTEPTQKQYQVLRLDRYGRDEQLYFHIRKQHTEGRQQTIDSAGSAHHDAEGSDMQNLAYKNIEYARTDAGDQVKNSEPFGAPIAFQDRPHKREGQHIEKDVADAAVHKHIGEKLVGPETIRMGAIERKVGGNNIDGMRKGSEATSNIDKRCQFARQERSYKDKNVDHDQIPYNRGKSQHNKMIGLRLYSLPKVSFYFIQLKNKKCRFSIRGIVWGGAYK